MTVSQPTACVVKPAIGFYDKTWAKFPGNVISFGSVQPGSFSDPVDVYVGNNICSNKGQFDLPNGADWKTVDALKAICVGFPTATDVKLVVKSVDNGGVESASPFTATGSEPQASDTQPYASWLLQYLDPNTNKYMDLTDSTILFANLKGDWYNKDVHNGKDPVDNYGKVTLRIFVPATATQNVTTKFKLKPSYTFNASTTPAPFTGVQPLQDGVCSPITT